MTDLACDAFIDGRWVPGSRRFAVTDPFDGAEIAQVTDGDEAMVDHAVDAAQRAFAAWKRRPAPERGKLLAAMAQRMLADERMLAELCTRENGKAMKESLAEVRYAASFLSWFAGEAERMYGEIIPASHPNQRLLVTREPIGPCALITPWNFPYAMLTRKLGAALAAGCTVVAKPAEQTPLGTLALARIAEQCRLPPGVFNVVPTSDAATVAGHLLAAPQIKKISFTGSTEVGKLIMRNAADDLKRVSLELGGNAPFIVLASADLDAAVAGAMIAKFRNSGQTCVAANRFIVEESVREAFTGNLIAQVAKLVTGRGADPTTDVGPLIDDAGVKKVVRLVGDAIARGATVLHGRPPDGTSRLVTPLVLGDITSDMMIWRSEIFGPVIAIASAQDTADAIAKANDTTDGLVAYLFAKDALSLCDQLEAGMVGLNEGLVSTAQAPFGGVKHSGQGREGSRHGLSDYTNLKYIAMRS